MNWQTSSRVFVWMCVALFLSWLVCVPVFAQGNAGRIQGIITDQSGGAIAGAMVTVTDTQRNVSRNLVADDAGAYNAPNLLPSTYKVRAEAAGFRATERPDVLLEIGLVVRVDLELQPGEITQTVTVSEALPMVNTTTAELGGTLQSQIIETLPLNGRNFTNLLQLRPGFATYPGGSLFSQSSNGMRAKANLYLVNGVNTTDPWMGQGIMNAGLNAGDAGTILSIDAIDEFKTEQNPRAEYGWKPGGIVNVGIKSGTNVVHGTAFAYGRDTSFGARNYFNPAPAPKAPVALEQFGGTVGGPIKKDKLFYFGDYEGQRYSIGNSEVHNFPVTSSIGNATNSLIDACLAAAKSTTVGSQLTALSAELAGLSFNRATLGTPAALGNCTPITMEASLPGEPPNGFVGLFPINPGPATAVPTISPNTNAINGGLMKLDYHLSDHHSIQGMYFFSQGDLLALTASTSGTAVSSAWQTQNHGRSETGSGNWTWTPNSKWVNDLRFGYAHYYQSYFSNDHAIDPANYDFHGATFVIPTGVTNPLYFGFPGITITGLTNPPAIGGSWPKIVGPDRIMSLVDQVSVLRGTHALKFGGELLSSQSSEDVTANAKGPINFAGLTNFFSGTLQSASLFTGDPARTLSTVAYALFAQDDWRIRPRLTLNLGIRYELTTVVKDKNNQLGNFDPVRGLLQVGKGINAPYNGDHNNFAPRLGFAWDVAGDGKTVVRGAAGIVYESSISFDVTNGIGNLLGLRTIPTGLPLFNVGSTAPLPTTGDITLASTSYTAAALTPIQTAWRNFDPTKPISATNAALYANAASPACGDNFTLPAGYSKAPAACVIAAIDPNFRTPYVENWNLGIQRAITKTIALDVSYVGNHGVKLIGMVDLNQPQSIAGFSPGWGNPATPGSAAALCIANYANCKPNGNAEQAARPFTAPCAASIPGLASPNRPGGPFNPNNSCFSFLKTVGLLNNGDASSYNALQATLTGRNYHGLTFTAGYTYSHSLGFASDQGTTADFGIPIDSYSNIHSQLWANSNFDLRHRFTLSWNYNLPSRKGFGQMLEGWAVNSIVLLQSGNPWGEADINTDFSGTGENISNGVGSVGDRWNFYGNASDFTPVHGWTDTNCNSAGICTGGLPYFPGTTNAACLNQARANDGGAARGLSQASLTNLGCYAVGDSILLPPAYGSYGTTARNPWHAAPYKDLDMSVAKSFRFHERVTAQFRAEFFNVFNRPQFCNPNGAGGHNPQAGPLDPSSHPFGFSGATYDVCSRNPALGAGGPRSMQLGLKVIF